MSSGVVWFRVAERFFPEPAGLVRSTGQRRRSASWRHMVGYLLPLNTTTRSPV